MDTPPAPSPADFASSTPHETVEAAMGRLTSISSTPVADHVAVYDDIHTVLQDALTQIDAD